MFSFFSRGKKKVDVNANDLPQNQPTQNTSPHIFTPFFQVTTSVVPNASGNLSTNSNSERKTEPTQNSTPVAPFITDASCTPSDGIGNGIVKMCKNKTEAPAVGSCSESGASKTTATTVDAVVDSNDNCHTATPGGVRTTSGTTMSSVKPAGHGTIAISPRIPTPNASRRNSAVTPTPTPPESPRIVEVYGDCNGFPHFPNHTNGATNRGLPEAPPRLRIKTNETTVAATEDERQSK